MGKKTARRLCNISTILPGFHQLVYTLLIYKYSKLLFFIDLIVYKVPCLDGMSREGKDCFLRCKNEQEDLEECGTYPEGKGDLVVMKVCKWKQESKMMESLFRLH